VADLTQADVPVEAVEAVRLNVEHTLASEQVDLTSQDGRDRTQEIIAAAIDTYHARALNNGGDGQLSDAERHALAQALRDDFIGLGTLAEHMLADPVAQEWMINGPKVVFRDDGQRIERVTDVLFNDDRQVQALIERLLERAEGKRFDRITPVVEVRLPDGSRLTAAMPPISSNGHTICTIRRFRLAANTLDELTELDFLSEQAAEFLTAAVRAAKNIVVAGPVSAGKTTLLNALGRAIPSTERVVTCESSAELKLPEVLPNCVGYEARPGTFDGLPAISLEKLVAEALRMNPRRIIVGECRGPETMAMLWALATGHAGMTSVHGESAEHALNNLVRFALTSGENIESDQAREWLREIDIVIHCDRPRSHGPGNQHFLPRRIDQIVEVAGVEGHNMTLNPLFNGTGTDLAWAATASPNLQRDLEQIGYQVP
jgi:pilus assembly protein CpaF